MLDQEITRVEAALKRLSDQERRLVRLYSVGEMDDSVIKRGMQQLKKQRNELEADVVKLEKRRLQFQSLSSLTSEVKQFCSHVAWQLGTLSFDDRRLALKAPQVKVVAGIECVKLFGAIPRLDFNATIAQTWG